MRRANSARSPSRPTSPKAPTYNHSEHRYSVEWLADIDGYGVSEVDSVDGEPLCTVRAVRPCEREGCECRDEITHLYTLSDVPDEAVTYYDRAGMDVVEECATSAVIADWDYETPLLAITMGDELSGLFEPSNRVEDRDSGECYGRPDEPSPEPHGL